MTRTVRERDKERRHR